MKKNFLILMLALTPIILGLCLLMGASGIGMPNLQTGIGRAILILRLDRVFTGFIVGAALACAGTVLQALLRNPLAEPYVLGVSSGAGLGAALVFVLGLTSVNALLLPLSAFIFASLTLALVYALACSQGKLSIYGLILSGVIVSSVCSSLLMFFVTLSPDKLPHVMWWMLGNLEQHQRTVMLVSTFIIATGIGGIWLMAPELNALSLGRNMAHYVGVRTKLCITLGLALATLVSATAVALAGLIGFVGLIVPHVVRSIIGPDHRRLIPSAALTGGLFLVICDAAARTIMAPREIPVGVITALIGGPFFIMILRRRRKQNWVE